MKPIQTRVPFAPCLLLLLLPLAASAQNACSEAETGDFEGMLKEAVAQRDHFLLAMRMQHALEMLNEDNVEKAVGILEQHVDKIYKMHAWDLFVRYWAMFDPEAALEYSLSHFGAERHRTMSAALHSWARYDPPSAIAWAEEHALGKYRRSVFQGAIIGWALVDLSAATEYVRTMPEGIDREWAIRRIAKAQLHDGVEAFEEWIASVSDESERNIAIDFASPWGRYDSELVAMFKRLKG